MGKQVLKAVFLGLLLLAATGCVHSLDGDKGDGVEVSTSLALSLKNVGSRDAATKMSQEITQTRQTGNNFRGIEEVIVVPFKTDLQKVNGEDEAKPVTSADERFGNKNVGLQNPGISASGLVELNNSHLFNIAIIPWYTNRVLVYGKAKETGSIETPSQKHTYGVLTPVNLENLTTAADISFCLEPIVGEDALQGTVMQNANSLISALNGVVAVLQQTSDPQAPRVLNRITHAGDILACSFQTFDRIYDVIYEEARNNSSYALTIAKDDFLSAGSFLNATISGNMDFPASCGIPEGAVGFWWDGLVFRQLVSGVNIRTVPVVDFCYPPSLWYFANSTLVTSKERTVEDEYVSTRTTWSSITDLYDDGITVVSSTRSAAVVDQLQYGVGMMKLKLSTDGLSGANGCPLTGIIVGDQEDVDFSFRPKGSSARYVYDIVENGPKIGDAGNSAITIPTLLLETAENQVVHFILEFQNTTGQIIEGGQQGDILPRCKFYVAGELNPSNGTAPDGKSFSSVIIQDHCTSVTVKVVTLANAYNTIPDLHEPQLEIGIKAEMDWVQVTPGSVKLNL